jgi:hypothetical protein
VTNRTSDLPPEAYHDTPWTHVLPWLAQYDTGAAPELSVAAPSPDWWLTESPAVTTMAVDHDEVCRRLAHTFVIRHPEMAFHIGFPTLPTRLPLAALPASASARTVFQRLQARVVADLAPMSVQDLYDIRGTGQGTVEEIITALVSAAIVLPAAQGASIHDETSARTHPLPPAHAQLLQDLGQLAAWRHLRNSSGLPLLKVTVEDQAPEQIQEAVQRINFLTASDIAPRVPAPDPVLDLTTRLSQLDDVQTTLLHARLLATEPKPATDLAVHMGLGEARLLHLETRIKDLLASTFGFGTTIGNLLASIRIEIQPVAALQRLTDRHPELTREVPGINVPLWLVLDRLDDYFEVTDGWAATPDVNAAKESTRTILDDLAAEHGLVHIAALQTATSMPLEELQAWVAYCGYPMASQHVLTRTGSIEDHAAGLLAAHGEALPIQELHRHVNPDDDIERFAEHLAADERFLNLEASTWDLVASRHDEEAAIRRQIDLVLAAGSGQIPVETLVRSIADQLDVSSGSVRAHASTGDHEIIGEMVRRRQLAVPPGKPPAETRRLYRQTDRWTYRVTVTRDHLRGSTFPLPTAVAGLVGCGPGEIVELDSHLGVQHVSWTGRQPSCGTVKRFLDTSNAHEGQIAFLEFLPNGGFNVRLSPRLSDADRPLQRALALTGAAPSDEADIVTVQLAECVGLPPDAKPRQILSAFQRRGDEDIAELLEQAWTRPSAPARHVKRQPADGRPDSDGDESRTTEARRSSVPAEDRKAPVPGSAATDTPLPSDDGIDVTEEGSEDGHGGPGDDSAIEAEWVPVPEGLRSVGWIKSSEAEAAAEAYRARSDVPVQEHGRITGWARYHDDDTAEARKFRANVLLVRSRAAGERFVCWIREHEAAGIIQADRRGSTVPLSEQGGGWTGRVEYFPPASPAAQRFRSTTRLLRARKAKQGEPE